MTSRQTAHAPNDPAQPSFADLLFAPETEPGTATPDNPAALEEATLPVYRVQLVREGEIAMEERPQLQKPADIAQLFYDYLKDRDREYFVMLMLDTKNRLIGLSVVSIGILDSALVHPREVYKGALAASAASIVVCHNHPSGDPTPSLEDRRITERLREAGELLGIELLDHIVVGEKGKFVSLREQGVL